MSIDSVNTPSQHKENPPVHNPFANISFGPAGNNSAPSFTTILKPLDSNRQVFEKIPASQPESNFEDMKSSKQRARKLNHAFLNWLDHQLSRDNLLDCSEGVEV
jgi:hypothetical protein